MQIAKKSLCLMLLASFFMIPTMAPTNAIAAEEFVTIGTGGMTGVYYPVGGAICRLINKGRADHNLRCTAESTGASVFNVNAIRGGDLNLGIVQSDTQYYAYNGKEQFESAGAYPDLRVLFSLYAEAFTVVARDDSNIKSFKDLAGKRVNLGDPGSGNRNTMELLMKEYGWTEKTFALATDLKPAEMAGALCDNKFDAYVYVIGHPNGSIKEASTTCASHIVPVEGPEVDKFMEKYPFYPAAIVPGGMYKGTPEAVKTFGPRATIMASTDLGDDTAYIIVKTVFTNLEEFKKLHPALSTLTPEDMIRGNSAPFHPGAIRYFKEAGLLNEDGQPVSKDAPAKAGDAPVVTDTPSVDAPATAPEVAPAPAVAPETTPAPDAAPAAPVASTEQPVAKVE